MNQEYQILNVDAANQFEKCRKNLLDLIYPFCVHVCRNSDKNHILEIVDEIRNKRIIYKQNTIFCNIISDSRRLYQNHNIYSGRRMNYFDRFNREFVQRIDIIEDSMDKLIIEDLENYQNYRYELMKKEKNVFFLD